MYTRILVAIDDSPTAAKALDEAIRLASALGAALCVAHAADEGPITQHGMTLEAHIDIDKVKADMRDDSNKLLDQAVATAAAAGAASSACWWAAWRKTWCAWPTPPWCWCAVPDRMDLPAPQAGHRSPESGRGEKVRKRVQRSGSRRSGPACRCPARTA